MLLVKCFKNVCEMQNMWNAVLVLWKRGFGQNWNHLKPKCVGFWYLGATIKCDIGPEKDIINRTGVE